MDAAIYLRISLDRYGDGLAVERQENDCRKILEARGWTLHSIYSDNSISASDATKNRPGYQAMIRDYEAGLFGAIVCWDLDRLTRQPRQLEDWCDAAEKRGLVLVTANGEADLGTDNGRMFARIKAAVARGEVERKSSRQIRAAQQRAEKGTTRISHRPFGYLPGRAGLHPDEAPVARWMYDEFLAGVNQHEIARRLNAKGIKTSFGNEWSQPVLRQFLRKASNAGLSIYKGEIVGRGQWEPLVPEEIWRAAMDKFDRATKHGGGGGAKYLLVGIATCGGCGALMRTAFSIHHQRLYSCRAKRDVSRGAEPVEELVVKTVKNILRTRGAAALVPPRNDADRDLPAKAEALRSRLDALAVEFADGDLTASQLRVATARIQEKIDALNKRMAASAADTALAPMIGATDIDATWDSLDMARKRGIIRALMTVKIMPT